jgi:hypothetical protein
MGLESLNSSLIALNSPTTISTPSINISPNKVSADKTAAETPSGQPNTSKNAIDKAAGARAGNVALFAPKTNLEQAAEQIATDTASVEEFKKAYYTATGKAPSQRTVNELQKFLDNPGKYIANGGADLAQISSYTVEAGFLGNGGKITVDPSKKASIDAARATVLNTYNNIAWAQTARLQLQVSRDQLQIQKQVAVIQQSGLTVQQKSLKISELTLGLNQRNESRQVTALKLQQSSVDLQKKAGEIQGNTYRETMAYNSQALANQRTQLTLQERSINQTASNANRAYDQSERISANNIANTNLNARQNRVFQRAIQQETAYNTAKVNWNTEVRVQYKDKLKMTYDQDGWLLPPAFNGSSEVPLNDRMQILNSAKNATPRPNFSALERQFSKESDSSQSQPSTTANSGAVSQNSKGGNSYYSSAEINNHRNALSKAVETGEWKSYVDIVRRQYAGPLSKAYENRLVELRVIQDSIPSGATGSDKKIVNNVIKLQDRLGKNPPPNQAQFIKDSQGTVNVYYGR